jgi:hypothetical protein
MEDQEEDQDEEDQEEDKDEEEEDKQVRFLKYVTLLLVCYMLKTVTWSTLGVGSVAEGIWCMYCEVSQVRREESVACLCPNNTPVNTQFSHVVDPMTAAACWLLFVTCRSRTRSLRSLCLRLRASS